MDPSATFEIKMTPYIPKHVILVKTHDMHTAGEPLRIITSGLPPLEGSCVLEKVQYMKKKYDYYRKLIISEPRGHKDMYGALLIKNESCDNHFDAIFLNNEGYSSMCGHAVIALGRYVLDVGLVKCCAPEVEVIFHCPCGPVRTYVQYDGSCVSGVRFHSVPAFVFKLGVEISVPEIGNIVVDISFGGAFYVIIEDKKIGLSIDSSSLTELINRASSITEAVKEQVVFYHPESEDLAFLYGTIITDGKDDYLDGSSKNVCVFADKEVDRSPTGSGVTARIALQVKKGLMRLNQEKEFRSIIDTCFTGKAIKKTKFGDFEAVIVEVSGMAYHTGNHTFYLEENDPLPAGFQLPR